MNFNMNICPICEEGHLRKVVKQERFEYKGNYKIIDDFVVYYCDECDDEIVPESSIRSSEKEIRDFHREVDGLLTSREIRRIREAYGFTQDDFSELLGLGKKTFSRYENSTVTQNRTTDHLLRIIDTLPESLDVICKRSQPENYRINKFEPTEIVPADRTLIYKYRLEA